MPTEVQMETVPAGTRPSVCRASQCRATIYWIQREQMKKGQPVPGTIAKIPVDCAVLGGENPTTLAPGRGANHYTTCVAAGQFHRTK